MGALLIHNWLMSVTVLVAIVIPVIIGWRSSPTVTWSKIYGRLFKKIIHRCLLVSGGGSMMRLWTFWPFFRRWLFWRAPSFARTLVQDCRRKSYSSPVDLLHFQDKLKRRHFSALMFAYRIRSFYFLKNFRNRQRICRCSIHGENQVVLVDLRKIKLERKRWKSQLTSLFSATPPGLMLWTKTRVPNFIPNDCPCDFFNVTVLGSCALTGMTAYLSLILICASSRSTEEPRE